MQVHLLGTRGSIPSGGSDYTRYGGNTSCVALAHDGEPPSLILDAGSGLAAAGWVIGDAAFRGSILLTHLHWDHVLGLPFFREGDREGSSVRLLVPEQENDIDEVLSRFFSPPLFPVAISDLRGNWETESLAEGSHTIEGFEILALDIPHKGGRTFGFRVSDGTASVAYMPDHSPTSLGPGPLGNGAHHEAAMRLASGVDLLIHDSQFTPEEFETRSTWGHCVYDYPIGLAEAAGAAHTLLFHHDPFRSDDEIDRILRTISDENASFAVEGTSIQLGPDS